MSGESGRDAWIDARGAQGVQINRSGGNVQHNTFHAAPAPPVSWPVRVGVVPGLASAFQTRTRLREKVEAARNRTGAVVLTQVLSGGGGVGKSQLAASYADASIGAGLDLLVWIDARSPAAVIAGFAQAGVRVQAPGVGVRDMDTEADAKAFLDWVATTKRSWLVVLDDIADPQQINPWWPSSHTGTGWVLATTRRRDAVLSGAGRVLVDVDVFDAGESERYLRQRLSGVGLEDLCDDRAGVLAQELGHLPLALSHAAAYMIDQRIGSAAYLDRYTAGRERLDALMPATADADGYGRQVAITLLLALDAADACEPVGLARPAIRLAAVLDPAGHPDALWDTTAFTACLRAATRPRIWSRSRRKGGVVPGQARAALHLLHRYGLLSLDGRGPQGVRIHAVTARAARETIPAKEVSRIVRYAADAVQAVWPETDHADPALVSALRANTECLHSHAGDALWHPDRHPVLFWAGLSLLNAGLHDAAVTFWQHTSMDARRVRGSGHPDTVKARANLAASYAQAGRTGEAITIQEEVVEHRMRVLGAEHPDTLLALANLASSYTQAGRTGDAVAIEESVATVSVGVRGAEEPDTLIAKTNLATSYAQAGHIGDAIALLEEVVGVSTRVLGAEHPNTLTARTNLATFYGQAGRIGDAISLLEEMAAVSTRVLGAEHPSTLTARANLATAHVQAGHTRQAIALLEEVVSDRVRILGADHPDTLTVQGSLAAGYEQAGDIDRTIALLETVTAGRVRVLGTDHPDTLAVMNLRDRIRGHHERDAP